MSTIVLTDPRDIALAQILQGAQVNGCLFPSGLVVPSVDMVVEGNRIVPGTRDPSAGMIVRHLRVRERKVSP